MGFDEKEHPNLKEYGFKCPRCERWQHLNYSDDNLEALRQALQQAQEAVKTAARQSDTYNARLAAVNEAQTQHEAKKQEFIEAFEALNEKIRAITDAKIDKG